jgi:hypothetical protein
MRGFLQPSFRHDATEIQEAFRALSRNRRSELAEKANTTLVKASQWARGDAVAPAVASALEAATKAHLATRKS